MLRAELAERELLYEVDAEVKFGLVALDINSVAEVKEDEENVETPRLLGVDVPTLTDAEVELKAPEAE